MKRGLLAPALFAACVRPTAPAQGPAEDPGTNATPALPPCPEGMAFLDTLEAEDDLGPFCIAKTEATVAQYAECVNAGACTEPGGNRILPSTWKSSEANYPVNYLSLEQARAYCGFREARLPTQTEWRWALGSGQGWALPWGNERPPEFDSLVCVPDLDTFPCPVGTHPRDRTHQGVLDLVGSVGEYVTPDDDDQPYILSGQVQAEDGYTITPAPIDRLGVRCAADASDAARIEFLRQRIARPRIALDCPDGMQLLRSPKDTPANRVLEPFCLGKTEVSVGEYRSCVDAGQCTAPSPERWADVSADRKLRPEELRASTATWPQGDPDLPINFVTWTEATRYCAVIGGRLPTVDEWRQASDSLLDRMAPAGELEWHAGKERVCGERVRTLRHVTRACRARQFPLDRTERAVHDMVGSLFEYVRFERLGAGVAHVLHERYDDFGLQQVRDLPMQRYDKITSTTDADAPHEGLVGIRCAATPLPRTVPGREQP